MISVLAVVFTDGLTVLFTKVLFCGVKDMGLAGSKLLMESYMKGNGMRTKIVKSKIFQTKIVLVL